MEKQHYEVTAEYEAASKAIDEASKKFGLVQVAYRKRVIGDAEFLAAGAEWKAAITAFDAIYDAEVAGVEAKGAKK